MHVEVLQNLDSIREELLDILETLDILVLFWPQETCKPSLLWTQKQRKYDGEQHGRKRETPHKKIR